MNLVTSKSMNVDMIQQRKPAKHVVQQRAIIPLCTTTVDQHRHSIEAHPTG
jgi:hypothetical protein